MMGLSEGHIRHCCRNYVDGGGSGRAYLPPGFGAFRWAGVYVIYLRSDADVIAKMFEVELVEDL